MLVDSHKCMNDKQTIIEEFLKKLGDVPRNDGGIDGFTIICNKCGSNDVIFYDDICEGSEYTGTFGDAGLKCKGCGNAKALIEY